MKFAFIIMGDFNSEKDKASIHGGTAQIIGVSSLKEACEVAIQLQNDSVGCIELCGAFGEEGVKKVIDATNYKLPVGYVTHLVEQNDIFKQAFSLTND